MPGIVPTRVPQVAVLQTPSTVVYVESADDLPAPSSGAITLVAGAVYIIAGDVDLAGSRLIPGENSAIVGEYTESSSLTSSGLGSGVALFQGAAQFLLRDITIKNVGTGFDLDGGGGSKALEWARVNLSGIPALGTIANYANVLLDTVGMFAGSKDLTFTGTIDTLAVSNSIFVLTGSSGAAIVVDALTVSRRIRIQDCAFVLPAGTTGVSVSASTIPDEGLIINTAAFTGSGDAVDGVTNNSDESLFRNCDGLDNSFFASYLTMVGNATSTTISTVNTPVKVAGTTVSQIGDRFTNTANRATYNGAKTRLFRVGALISFDGSDEYTGYIAVNGSVVSETGNTVDLLAAAGSGAMALQHIAELSSGDYVEVWIENNNDTSNVLVPRLSLTVSAMG